MRKKQGSGARQRKQTIELFIETVNSIVENNNYKITKFIVTSPFFILSFFSMHLL